MANESITFKLVWHVSDIIGLIKRSTCQSDLARFRPLVVRYCDNIASGEAVMAFIQEVTELLMPLPMLGPRGGGEVQGMGWGF